jgi:glyoxylase-like metal-dependent hydrolase (beta-lactamase superfamily II)
VKKLLRCVYQLDDTNYNSYLLQTAEGNVLIDTPSLVEHHLETIQELGGAKTLFITHRDDVSDACAWQEELGLEIVMHQEDAHQVLDCSVDHEIEDEEEWLAKDMLVIHLPGHSPGCVALLYTKGGGILFSGDALVTRPDGTLGLAPERYSSDPALAGESARQLLDYEFGAILPAHGTPILKGARQALEAFLSRLRAQAAGGGK